MPAPAKNQNRLTHGVNYFLATGALPPGASYVQKVIAVFRRAVEYEIAERNGELSLYHHAVIQTACRHEVVAQLWQRWLKAEAKNMSVGERLSVTQAIARASTDRDKCLKELRLDRRPGDDNAWDALNLPGVLEAEPVQATEPKSEPPKRTTVNSSTVIHQPVDDLPNEQI